MADYTSDPAESKDALLERDGKVAFFYSGEVPWHGLGQSVAQDVTAGEAIVHAGLDFSYNKEQAYLPGGGPEIPGVFAITRDYDRRVIGSVGPVYKVIQPKDCFDFMDGVIGEGQAVYHTAGALLDGQILFMSVRLNDSVWIGPDKIDKYLFLSNTYDGSGSLHLRWTPIRPVCQNTYNLALNSKTNNKISIRHTSSYESKMAAAREALELTEHYYGVMSERFTKMLDVKFTQGDMEKFTEQLFPATVSDTTGETRVTKKTKAIRSKLVELFYEGKGQQEVKETKWAAMNAVTDYIDHYATVRATGGKTPQEARVQNALFGIGHDTRQRGYNLLTQGWE